MRKRDLDIIDALNQFRALSRDQVAELFFTHTRNPIRHANEVLKRLRDRGYIDVDIDRKPFVYFPKPSRIRKGGQKVDHFLAIADFYLQLRNSGTPPKTFTVEAQFPDVEVRPDIFMSWKGSLWFVEVQLTQYTQRQMAEKLQRYERFFDSQEWRSLPGAPAKFPHVWIVAPTRYGVESRNFRVLESRNVAELLAKVSPKPKAPPLPSDINIGGLNVKMGAR